MSLQGVCEKQELHKDFSSSKADNIKPYAGMKTM